MPDGRTAIAVLPFVNLSGDPAQGYFSDGITEEIITDLSRWRRLAVQSRSASFRYRDAATDLPRIARELNIRYIVEGSVRRLGERLRITAQLIDTETGSHVWADRFDCENADLFKLQDEVVQTIVSTLVGRVDASDVERARRKPPASLAAYECVLRGNAMPWSDPDGAAEATRLFEKAIEIDPDYGIAYALLAVMRYHQWFGELSSPDECRAGRAPSTGAARRGVRRKRKHLLFHSQSGLSVAPILRSRIAAHAAGLGDQFDQSMEYRRHGEHPGLSRPG